MTVDVPVEHKVEDELSTLRSTVSGIDGCIVSTTDGLLVAHVLPDEEQSQLAALIASVVGLARHAVDLTGRGSFVDAAMRGSSGHMVVYAVGESAVLAVLGRSELNVALLHLRTRPVVERLVLLAPDFAGFIMPSE